MIQRTPGIPPGFPDSTTRSVVSVVLFAHLFVVLAALYGGLSPGRDGDQNLKERLREVVAPYTQSLNFDTTARFHLTHATADDVDCRIEYLPKTGDPNTATDWVILESGIRGSEQRQRHQRAQLAGVDEQHLAAPIPPAAARVLVPGQEPQAGRNLRGIKKLPRQSHHAVHRIQIGRAHV